MRFVLEKDARASDTAKLYCVGRDKPYQEMTLRFRKCSWELIERKEQAELARGAVPSVLLRLVSFMTDKERWTGTATELLTAMGETETAPTVITKWLNEYRTAFLSENGIGYAYCRSRNGRQIVLTRNGVDRCDSDIGIPTLNDNADTDTVLLSEAAS